MIYKKMLLISLLVFAVASLGVIVYFAKTRQGIFGKSYRKFLSNQTVQIGQNVISNLEDISSEALILANDRLVMNVFYAQAFGDDVKKYSIKFNEIKDALKDCTKINIVDKTGSIIFSTIPEETYSRKVKSEMMSKLEHYFFEKKNPYIHFLNNRELVAIVPFYDIEQTKDGLGYVLLYYQNDRLLQGIERKDLSISLSYDNSLIISTTNLVLSSQVTNILLYFAGQLNTNKSDSKSPDRVAYIRYKDDLNIAYYPQNLRFLPPITVPFLLVNLALIGLIIYTLQMVNKEHTDEKYYIPKHLQQAENFEDYESELNMETIAPTRKFAVPNQNEIQQLVKDIESEEKFSEKESRNGIEQMIMTSDVDLTAAPFIPGDQNKNFEAEMPEVIEEEGFQSLEELGPSKEFQFEESQPKEFTPAEVEAKAPSEFSSEFEKQNQPNEQVKMPDFADEIEGEQLSDSLLEAPVFETPVTPTEMFSEHERILGEIEQESPKAPADVKFETFNKQETELISEDKTDDIAAREISDQEIQPQIQEIDASELPESTELEQEEFTSEALSSEMEMIESEIMEVGVEGPTGIIEEEIPSPQPAESASGETEAEIPIVDSGLPEFDLEAAIPTVPTVEEDDENITLAPSELAAIDIDLSETDQSEEFQQPNQQDVSQLPETPVEVELESETSPEIPSSMEEIPMELEIAPPSVEEMETTDSQDEFDLNKVILEIPSEVSEEEDQTITLNQSELSSIALDSSESTPGESTPVEVEVSTTPAASEDSRPTIDFAKVFREPPVRISSINDVESYSDVAKDLALNRLNLSKVSVLKKTDEGFSSLMADGFSKPIQLTENDPILNKFLKERKSLVIKGDLTVSRYLRENFDLADLERMEELMIVPVIKNDQVQGVAFYGRDKGTKEPTYFQKSELHNLGFLQMA